MTWKEVADKIEAELSGERVSPNAVAAVVAEFKMLELVGATPPTGFAVDVDDRETRRTFVRVCLSWKLPMHGDLRVYAVRVVRQSGMVPFAVESDGFTPR